MRPETAENRRCPAGSGADPAPTGSGAAVHQNFGGNPNVKFVSNRDLLNFWGPGLGFPPESAGFPPEFWISAGIRRNPPELWFSI